MKYLMALIFPPIAVLMCGKPGQAFLNLILWLCMIIPGVVHGFLVVNQYNADKRHKEMLQAMSRKG